MEEECFEGRDAEIVVHIMHLITVERGEPIELEESDEDNEKDLFKELTITEVMQMCEKLEAACWRFGYLENGLTLPQELHRFHRFLRQTEETSKQQVTLESYWTKM